MAFWIEIRCEGRHLELDQHGNKVREENEECASFLGADTGILIHESIQDVLLGKQLLEKIARDSGYKRTRKGWHCPSCVALKRHKRTNF